MIDTSIPAIVAIILSLLLAALVAALIFSRGFRDAVLGGRPGEAKILNLITVKGVAIVLLIGLMIGGIMWTLDKLPSPPHPATPIGPITMRLNVHFEPDEVNPRNPQFRVSAFMKTPEGLKPIKILPKVSEGALSVNVTVPDMDTPFFIIFETPKGTWRTDDHSIKEAAATARKQ
jgi:hypothetical protein